MLTASYTQLGGSGVSGRASTQPSTYATAQSQWAAGQQWQPNHDGSQAQPAANQQQPSAQTAAAGTGSQEEQFSEMFQMLNSAAGTEFGEGLGMFNTFTE